jgi:nucleoside-diphosphate-sugar epimerase
MNILLTGAAGFIGSNLAQKLLNNPFQLSAFSFEPSVKKELPATSYELYHAPRVRAFLRYTSRADLGLLSLLPKHELSQIELILGDLRDPSAILEAARGCDLIYHLGALISIPYSYVHPVETVQSNILGTLNILEAARQLGIPVVHTSTSEVYGTALRVPIDETHPLQGQSPYSASKIGADKLVEAYYKSFNVPAITVRPFNTYGPGQSARAVIPTIITQALTQDHLNLGSLDTRRDFTYVDDTVSGFLLAGQALLSAVHSSSSLNPNPHIMPFGQPPTPNPYSVKNSI